MPYNHKRHTKKMRREFWGDKCDYCGPRWRNAKTNYMRDTGVCLFCHQALNAICARGAAWILKRRGTIKVWDKRYVASSGARSQRLTG